MTVPAPTIFQSDNGRTALAIQLADGGLELPGTFHFQVINRGTFSAQVTLKHEDSNKFVLEDQTVSARFTASGSNTPQTVTVRIEGELNPQEHTAHAVLVVKGGNCCGKSSEEDERDDDHNLVFHLDADGPESGNATRVVREILDATIAQNWHAVYQLLAPSLQGVMTEADFTSRRAAAPHVLSGTLSSRGQVSQDASGRTHFGQPLSVTLKMPDGSTRSAHTTLFLVRENQSWRFLTTTSFS
ncbi:MAG: hypothetical protein M3069_11955 [Chloroflexota bacterium]|nr:hypothetical protein [Chloroflexota bacterium]